MLRHGFFATAGNLGPDELRRLQALRLEQKIPLVGVTARPQHLRDRTLAILAQVGIETAGAGGDRSASSALTLDQTLFVGGRGDDKLAAIEDRLRALGVPLARAVVIDDLEENLAGPYGRGATAIRLTSQHQNFANFNCWQFYRLAETAKTPQEKLEYLINAFAVAGDENELNNTRGLAERWLPPAEYQEFLAATDEMREIVLRLPLGAEPRP